MTEEKFSEFAMADAKKTREDPENKDLLDILNFPPQDYDEDENMEIADGKIVNDDSPCQQYYRALELAFDVPSELFELIMNRDMLDFAPDNKEQVKMNAWQYAGSSIENLIRLARALFERVDQYEKIQLSKDERALFNEFYKELAIKYPMAEDYVDRVDFLLERTHPDRWRWEDMNVLNKVVWKKNIGETS